MNTKIIAGIIVGVAIIMLIFGFSSEDKVIKDIDSDEIEIISDNYDEGKQFTLGLSDSVTAVGP